MEIKRIALSFCIISLFCSVSFSAFASGEKMCGCYETKPISVENFIQKGNKISSYASACKAGYYVNGFVQRPVSSPEESGQYVIIESLKCCKVCETP